MGTPRHGKPVRFAIATIAFLVSEACSANDSWQYQASLAYVASKEEQVPSADYPTVGTGLSYSFSSLPLAGDYPLAESRFAERVGSFHIGYLMGRYEYDIVEEHDVSALSVSANLMHPGTDFAGSVAWRRARFSEAAYKPGFIDGAPGAPVAPRSETDDALGAPVALRSETIDMDTLAMSLGYFVRKHVLLGYAHSRTTTEFNYQPTGISPDRSRSASDRLFLQFLGKVGAEAHLAADLVLGRLKSEPSGHPARTNRLVVVQGRYYPNRRHGASIELGRNTGEDQDDEGIWYEVGYDVFVTSRFNVGGSFRQFLADDKVQGEDQRTLAAYDAYRF